MTAYEIMIKTNHQLIKGKIFTQAEKADITRRLRENKITDGRKRTFDAYAYPRFYIPPHNNGKKLQTIIPMSPKTNIVADNAYEYEILRLLHLFQPSGAINEKLRDEAINKTNTNPDDELAEMLNETLQRLKKTCFGYQSCHYAECFEAGLMVLRFLSFAAPHDEAWLQKQITMYNNHYADRKRHNGVQKYYWLILSDMPFEIAEREIIRQKDSIIDHLNRNYLIKNGNEDIALYAMRNALARLPEFSYIKNREPYVNVKNERLYFDMT